MRSVARCQNEHTPAISHEIPARLKGCWSPTRDRRWFFGWDPNAHTREVFETSKDIFLMFGNIANFLHEQIEFCHHRIADT